MPSIRCGLCGELNAPPLKARAENRGGALGLAILASLAASRTSSLLAAGDGPVAAINGGYHVAFVVGAVFAAAAAVVKHCLVF